MSRRIPVACLVSFAIVGLVAVAPSTAAALQAPRCSKTLLHDWYVDGQISGRYRITCYRAALAEVPSDEIVYGELKAGVSQALSSGIQRVKQQGVSVGSQTLLPALPASSSKSESHSALVFATLLSLTLLLLGWLLVRRCNFRSPR